MAHEHGETKEKVESITIKILDDGSYLYTVHPKTGEAGNKPMDYKTREYATDDLGKLMTWLNDDLGSPHVKEKGHRGIEDASFKELQGKIAGKKGFKPRYAGQSKEEAAGAIAASLKDKILGKKWRKD